MKKILFISLALVFSVATARGQNTEKRMFIKLHGTTRDESGKIIAGVNIYSLQLQKGVISDTLGSFSITSIRGDSVIYTLQGYRPALVKVPQEYGQADYLTDVIVAKDTLIIEEVVILPWNTYKGFCKEVTKIKPVSFEAGNMSFNILLVRKQLYENPVATPGEGYRFAVQQINYDCYTRGQLH